MFATLSDCELLGLGVASALAVGTILFSSWLNARSDSRDPDVSRTAAGSLLLILFGLFCTWAFALLGHLVFDSFDPTWVSYSLWSRYICWGAASLLMAFLFGAIFLSSKYLKDKSEPLHIRIGTPIFFGLLVVGLAMAASSTLIAAVSTSVDVREATVSRVVENYQVIDEERSAVSLTVHFVGEIPKTIVPLKAKERFVVGSKVNVRITTECGHSPTTLWLP